MLFLENLRSRITKAVKKHNEFERNILKVVLGEIQTIESRQGGITEDQAYKVVRKIIANNEETIQKIFESTKDTNVQVVGNAASSLEELKKENEILSSLLPQIWDFSTTEAFFLNSNSSEIEMIQNAKSEGQAIGIAMKALKSKRAPVDSKIVVEVVKKIRVGK